MAGGEPLELDAEPPRFVPNSPSQIASQIKSAPYDPSRDRESMRGKIAMRLVWTLMALVAGAFGLAVASVVICGSSACNAATASMEQVKTIVELLLTPMVGLVGAVTGFYFGEQSRHSKP